MKWIRCQIPNPEARLRLFFFPFAGGTAAVYNSWCDELLANLGRTIEFCSVHYPGHDATRTEALLSELSLLLDLLVPAIASYGAIPCAFFGHSMGALVSFELARQLRRQRMPGPVHLIVSGHRAPQLPNPRPSIHRLPDVEFQAQLRELGGTPEMVLQDPELMELLLPVLRADFAMCENYTYATEEPLDCSITAFGGNNDAKLSREELSAWQTQTRKSFSIRRFPGGHFFVQTAHLLVLRMLGEDLKQTLKRLPQGSDVASRFQ
jgi:medium-chain acyl-[acyl-carrier-protein] hydrolase